MNEADVRTWVGSRCGDEYFSPDGFDETLEVHRVDLTGSFVVAAIDGTREFAGGVGGVGSPYLSFLRALVRSTTDPPWWFYITEDDSGPSALAWARPHEGAIGYQLSVFETAPALQGGGSQLGLLSADGSWLLLHDYIPGNSLEITLYGSPLPLGDTWHEKVRAAAVASVEPFAVPSDDLDVRAAQPAPFEPVQRLEHLDGIVDYQTRPASTAAQVAEVCAQIAGGAWASDSPAVRLSGIDWQVLDVSRGEARHWALLLADRVVAEGPYHYVHRKTTWERCALRRWLNDDFCRSLGEPLTSRVLALSRANEPNPVYGTAGGNHTTDQFFLLSMKEAAAYLAGHKNVDWRRFKKRALPLAEAGMVTNEDGASTWWWLRSPGYRPVSAAAVRPDGGLYGYGASVSWSGGVRPAFWLNLEP
ncbi:MAG: DUF6273 domain-containing protein [Micrococcales bacterium]|nr:DUF6273 domain-containing protein [Micrococcales bacterium]